MSNLTRYKLHFFKKELLLSPMLIECDAGEYVKFDDIKELLNTAHNSRVMPCLMYAGVNEQCDVFNDDRCGSEACKLARI